MPRKYRRKLAVPRRRKPRTNIMRAVNRALVRTGLRQPLNHITFNRNTATLQRNSAGDVTHITAIAQGDDLSNRQGDNIVVKRIWIQGMVRTDTSSLDFDVIKFAIVQDTRQVDSTNPTYSAVYSTAGGGNDQFALCPLNNDNLGRFKILWSKVMAPCVGSGDCKTFSKYIKCNIPVRFRGTTGNTQTRNGLYLMINNDSLGSATTTSYSVRVFFQP